MWHTAMSYIVICMYMYVMYVMSNTVILCVKPCVCVCVCVLYIYVCIDIYIYTFMHACIHTRHRVSIHIVLHKLLHKAHTYTRMCVYMRGRVHVFECIMLVCDAYNCA